jgi:L,D-transpeptidase catalytic domain
VSRRTPALLALLAAVLAAPAAAQAAPAPATIGLHLGHLKGGKAKILSKVAIDGQLSPFVPGEQIRLLYFRNGHQVGQKLVAVQKGKDGKGTFETHFRVRRDGRFAIQAIHEASPALQGAASKRQKFGVRFPGLGDGECGRVVRGFKRTLDDLGYVPGGGSCMTSRTSRAVLAYRKVNGYGHNEHAGAGLVKRVFARKGRYHVKHRGAGEHVEVNIGKQVLVFVNKKGRAVETYHVSTGKSSTPTVTGHFEFYLRQPGYNSHAMYYSTYFHGGYAIHGYASVPATYPASHGCVRVPIPDAVHIYDKIFLGESIFVY